MSTSGCEVGVEGKLAGAWAAVVGAPTVEVAAWTLRTELLREATGTGAGEKQGGGEPTHMGDGDDLGQEGCCRKVVEVLGGVGMSEVGGAVAVTE